MIFDIQEMSTRKLDYFRYFSRTGAGEAWGLQVTASGYTKVPAGVPYPPPRHPSDHFFDWTHGRILSALQVVFIESGSGWFESRATGRKKVTAGCCFIVLPKTWHRYRPDHNVGWTESWLEIQGLVVPRLIRAGLVTPVSAFKCQSDATGLHESLEAVHARARQASSSFDAELAARGFAVLAAWSSIGHVQSFSSRIVRSIIEAERYLAAHHTERVDMQAVARRVGVAYSHFRRVFLRHTGFAPWQYVLRMRLARARRLLATGNVTLEQAATELGFSSAFHLSSAFKKAFGVAPANWRKLVRSKK